MTQDITAKITVQRSRFYAVFAPVNDENKLKVLLNAQRRAYRKARHHCLAARFIGENGQLVELARDDGEVGKPGYKMLELMRHKDVLGALIVSRIFGGVKLGPAGVGRAFIQAAQAVISEERLPRESEKIG